MPLRLKENTATAGESAASGQTSQRAITQLENLQSMCSELRDKNETFSAFFLTVSPLFISFHNITGLLPLWTEYFVFTAKLHGPQVNKSFRFGYS